MLLTISRKRKYCYSVDIDLFSRLRLNSPEIRDVQDDQCLKRFKDFKLRSKTIDTLQLIGSNQILKIPLVVLVGDSKDSGIFDYCSCAIGYTYILGIQILVGDNGDFKKELSKSVIPLNNLSNSNDFMDAEEYLSITKSTIVSEIKIHPLRRSLQIRSIVRYLFTNIDIEDLGLEEDFQLAWGNETGIGPELEMVFLVVDLQTIVNGIVVNPIRGRSIRVEGTLEVMRKYTALWMKLQLRRVSDIDTYKFRMISDYNNILCIINRLRVPQIRVSNTRLAQAASGCAPSVDVLPIFDVKQQSVRNPARMGATSKIYSPTLVPLFTQFQVVNKGKEDAKAEKREKGNL
ncbi:hypothetical protein WN51_03261 [Melipona quadrifasciata]|uniref:Uncharacterized protein n=1 Tax=Melipona quadrifasciata TaxID=166423 RepID=A0A0M8ZYP3_9HYME|nr:hypothetical protein WN51_03261 [Melipona quadrifasciata]